MKLTKRKGFNFFRSYYDVYNELSDNDKLEFINALLDRQFLGIKPKGLKGMAQFAYISQTNSIDSQVKGYEDKTGIKLNSTLAAPPTDGDENTPTEQVKEKGEVKVKEKGEEKEGAFNIFWDIYDKKRDMSKCKKKFISLSIEDISLIGANIKNYIASTPDKQYRKNPLSYLNSETWNDEIITSTQNNFNSTPENKENDLKQTLLRAAQKASQELKNEGIC